MVRVLIRSVACTLLLAASCFQVVRGNDQRTRDVSIETVAIDSRQDSFVLYAVLYDKVSKSYTTCVKDFGAEPTFGPAIGGANLTDGDYIPCADARYAFHYGGDQPTAAGHNFRGMFDIGYSEQKTGYGYEVGVSGSLACDSAVPKSANNRPPSGYHVMCALLA